MFGKSKVYRCVNCNKEISSRSHFSCPFCGWVQPLEERAKYLGETIVDIVCPQCGFEKSFFRSDEYMDVGNCPRCEATTYCNKEGKKPFETSPQSLVSKPDVECPYCHSKRTGRISKLWKVGTAATLGIFAVGKVSKQWHCNNCNSDF